MDCDGDGEETLRVSALCHEADSPVMEDNSDERAFSSILSPVELLVVEALIFSKNGEKEEPQRDEGHEDQDGGVGGRGGGGGDADRDIDGGPSRRLACRAKNKQDGR